MSLTYLLVIALIVSSGVVRLPVQSGDRKDVSDIQLTPIGAFGLPRKERPGVSAHLHAGIDVRRPSGNYESEPIFAVAAGTVISIRDNGPYAQVFIEHEMDGMQFWTNYEHAAGIEVKVGDRVGIDRPIARFMNKQELDRYGWQFDHFHFEVLKIAPAKVTSANELRRKFASYTLTCKTEQELATTFYEPLSFLGTRIKRSDQ